MTLRAFTHDDVRGVIENSEIEDGCDINFDDVATIVVTAHTREILPGVAAWYVDDMPEVIITVDLANGVRLASMIVQEKSFLLHDRTTEEQVLSVLNTVEAERVMAVSLYTDALNSAKNEK